MKHELLLHASEGDSDMTDSAESTDLLIDHFKQWKFNQPKKADRLLQKPAFQGATARNYWLKNGKARKFLQHEEQTVGINLGWTDDAEPATGKKVARWFFTRSAGGDRPIRYGDKVALGNGQTPSYIRYAERDVGINLDWSKTPVFEWQLLGGELGKQVDPDDYLAIYNMKAAECLLFFDRTAGADIGWPSSKTWRDQVGDLLAEAARNHLKKAYRKLLGRE
jgi:hypothetical protein